MMPGTLARAEPTRLAGFAAASLVAQARHRTPFRNSSGATERKGTPGTGR